MFKKILIANRGEIACRIMRTCRKLGITSVAIYSDADAKAQHVLQADEAYSLGDPQPSESYLNIKKILKIAKQAKVDAIHPGYGFLSENAAFADEVKKSGLVFIGPSAKVMRVLGDKIEAKKLAIKSKVPLVPGLLFKSQDPKRVLTEALAFANKAGYPLMIKAAAGGGGRGMRRVNSKKEIADALISASREAKAAFGDGRLFVEKLIEPARHVEVQVIGDSAGEVVALFDRDCSMQRNHQKVIEEAPAPGISDRTRASMQRCAQELCGKAGYQNAGTVEFLLSTKGEFFFLEVNSRLQVEHPVTEAITGLDLVELQIKIASGETLNDLVPKGKLNANGAAIECRLCAEIPEQNFIASTGKIKAFSFPKSENSSATIRIDTGFAVGDSVSHYYDSLLAKLIVKAATRDEAIIETQRLLSKASLCGIRSNMGFLHALISSREFSQFTHDTHFARTLIPTSADSQHQADLVITALLLSRLLKQPAATDAWQGNSSFQLFGKRQHRVDATVNGLSCCVRLSRVAELSFDVHATMSKFQISEAVVDGEQVSFMTPHGETSIRLYPFGESVWACSPFGSFEVRETSPRLKAQGSRALAHSGSVCSPLPGKIVMVKASAGSEVETGDPLMVIESMKMEHVIRAPHTAQVKQILVRNGDIVEANTLLAELAFSE